jgi:hypothetical protein
VSSASASDPETQAILRDWQAVRADESIQYAPLPMPAEPKPPEWLEKLMKWLSDLIGPGGEWLASNWPVIKWTIAGIGLLLAAWLLWRLLAPVLSRQRASKASEADWTPDHAEALALLEDADALAAQGRFDEATHLLLQRSVGQISLARPEWLDPSSTSREIAMLPALPERARRAFSLIAGRVERSLFALRPLDLADWQAARAAYADFAVSGLGGLA